MKKYDKYKDSSIEWIGEIPEHWDIKRLKYIGDSIIGMTYSPKEIVQKDGTLVLRSSNIQKGKLSLKDIVYISKDIPERLVVRKGDILICSRNGSRRLIGKNITIDKRTEGETFGAFMTVFRTEQYKFISKYFNSQVFSGQSGLFLTATINQLTINTLNNFYTALPPKQEQTAIANYLDRKTAQIDQLIKQKEQLLDLYEEEKTAIINQAVTKGINPKVKLKDSGVDWLGEIPGHWEVIKFNHYVLLRHGYQFRDYDFTDTGIKIIKITQLKANGELETEKVSFIDNDRLDEFKDIIINQGDVLMALTGGTIGKIIRVGKVKEPLLQNYRVGNFFPSNIKLDKSFLFWVLSSNLILEQIFFDQRETGQPNIGKEDFGRMIFLLPPKGEQTQIVNHIENEINRINTKVDKTKKLITLLKEYKTALISEVVTGKIKVFINTCC